MTDRERIEALEREVVILRGHLTEVVGFSLFLTAGVSAEDKERREDRFSKAEAALDKINKYVNPARKIGENVEDEGADE